MSEPEKEEKLDTWADKQLARMQAGASKIGREMVADIGSTYQAILMSDAGWRVPRAHGDLTKDLAEEAAAADLGKAVDAPTTEPTPQADVGLEPTME